MNAKNTSNERLNEHKTNTNTMISESNEAIKAISKINKKYQEIGNIPEMYRDKVYDLYTDLSKQKIDFWEDDFLLRDAILFHLRLKTLESAVYVRIIMEKILLSPKITIKSRILNERQYKSLKKEIEEIKNIGEYITNYDLEKDLNETIIEYFENIPVLFENPQSITEKYQKMKQNIEEIGNLESLKEEEIMKIIENKEEECLNYKVEEDPFYILFSEIQRIHDENKNKSKQRIRKQKGEKDE